MGLWMWRGKRRRHTGRCLLQDSGTLAQDWVVMACSGMRDGPEEQRKAAYLYKFAFFSSKTREQAEALLVNKHMKQSAPWMPRVEPPQVVVED